ncbi:LPS-assembly protein LptD [Hyphobacterium sp.]|uniref:LPS-assembly protein LptD n=1 Tax=Hyphobacterium sp. TaxID=2004662 RepID=UPI003BA88B7C
MRSLLLSAICLSALAPGLSHAANCMAMQDDTGNFIAPHGDEPVYIEADTLIENRETGSYIARGNVVARQNGRTVEADEVEYRPGTNRVIARGNVAIFSDTAPPQYADEIELDDALGEGLAVGFSTLLENNGRAAAAFAVRRANGSLELTNAYYTACRLGADGQEPTWRLRAGRAVQDADADMIYYRDVRLEVLGIPVAYAPAFAHADPSSERRSGFLFPTFGLSSRLGAFYGQPYYWAMSPYQDLTITPRIMQNANPLLELEYRRRFWSGDLAFETSYTNERDIDSDGNLLNDAEHRWHVFGGGEFDISENWEWGFGVQLASDDFHLRTYDISELYEDYPGILQPAPRRLMNQLYARGRTDTYYAEIVAAGVQSLREFELDERLPVMAPVAEFRLTTPLSEDFGRIRSVASTTVLTREDGVDYQRASASADWQAQFIAPAGLVFEPFAAARADYYNFNDVPGALPTDPTTEESFGRFLGYAGAEFSFPLISTSGSADTILEPMIQGVIASDASEAGRIVNQDSLTAELDETLLFDHNRATGYDLWEEGTRVTYGVRSTTFWGDDYLFRGFVGQSQRLDGAAAFSPVSGLFEENSDIIVAGEIDLGAFGLMARTRIDSDDGTLNRLDVVASYSNSRFNGQIRYFGFDDSLARAGTSEEIQLTTQTRITDRWSLVYNLQRDLENDVNRRQQIGFRYRDFCTDLELLYQREDLNVGVLGPSESIQFRVTLFTLGGIGSD